MPQMSAALAVSAVQAKTDLVDAVLLVVRDARTVDYIGFVH